MPYTILSVAYPLTKVGSDAAGGSEQILTLLDQFLTARGHRSLVLADGRSKITGTLIPAMRANGRIDDAVRLRAQMHHRELLLDTLSRHRVDLVHMHSLDFHEYLPPWDTPTLVTLHLPVNWYPKSVFEEPKSTLYMNCVSNSQHRSCPDSEALLPPIPNGIQLRQFRPTDHKENYVLALGRICPEKGYHLALEAAHIAGVPMILAGELLPMELHQNYFQREIAPRLDAKRRFIGAVGMKRKAELLAAARCLLVPSQVDETSSLVVMEAFACGTPAIAFRRGALPEIIENERTGYLVSNARQMAAAIPRVSSLKPGDCRAEAETRFSAQHMAHRYLATYEKILAECRVSERTRIRPGLSWLVS